MVTWCTRTTTLLHVMYRQDVRIDRSLPLLPLVTRPVSMTRRTYRPITATTATTATSYTSCINDKTNVSTNHCHYRQSATSCMSCINDKTYLLTYHAESTFKFLKICIHSTLYDTSSESGTQTQFDELYSTTLLLLLNQFYPEKTVAVRSQNPAYMTPDIKTKLCKKSHQMQAGQLDENWQ